MKKKTIKPGRSAVITHAASGKIRIINVGQHDVVLVPDSSAPKEHRFRFEPPSRKVCDAS